MSGQSEPKAGNVGQSLAHLRAKSRWACRQLQCVRLCRPNPRLARAVDIMFILHAEHEMNCSTAAARHLASSGVDVYTAIGGEHQLGCIGCRVSGTGGLGSGLWTACMSSGSLALHCMLRPCGPAAVCCLHNLGGGPPPPAEVAYQLAACGRCQTSGCWAGWAGCPVCWQTVGCLTAQPFVVRLIQLSILSKPSSAAAFGAWYGPLHVRLDEAVLCMLQCTFVKASCRPAQNTVALLRVLSTPQLAARLAAPMKPA